MIGFARNLTFYQKTAIALLCCAIVAWVAGPIGRLVVVIPLLLFGPGYIIEQYFPLDLPPVPFVRAAVWLGLSISSIALLYSWATVLHLTLTTLALALVAIIVGVGVLWLLWYSPDPSTSIHGEGDGTPAPPALSPIQGEGDETPVETLHAMSLQPDLPLKSTTAHLPLAGAKNNHHHYTWLAWVLLLGVFALTLWNRFHQIRDLVLPAWVDPIHHSLMIRVVLETGQAPYSLYPYLPVDNLPYHWGYHVLTAATIQLSSIPMPDVMLWQGQILNVLHVLTCAALAAYFWRSAHAGIVAAIVVGCISIMPAYYVSWGRYTHLTGMLILPLLAISWHALLHTRSRAWLVASTLMLAGLCLVHTLVLVLTLCLLAAITITWIVMHMESSWHTLWLHLRSLLAAAVLSLLLSLPWLWVILQRILLPSIDSDSSQTLMNGSDYVKLSEGFLWAGENRLLIALALLGLLWAFWHRSRVSLLVFVWVFIMAVLANPWTLSYILPILGMFTLIWAWQPLRIAGIVGGILLLLLNPWTLYVPYTWLITNDIMTFSLFAPISLLIGGGGVFLLRWIANRNHRVWRIILRSIYALALVAWAGWGTWNIRNVINKETILATAADTLAIEWIATHPELVPPDSRFLINAAGWFPNADRGTDGGYWLMPLLGYWTSTPPSMFIHGSPDYVQHMQKISHQNSRFQAVEPQKTALHHIVLDYWSSILPSMVMHGSPDYVQHMQEVSRQVSRFQAGEEQERALHQLIERERITHIYLREGRGPLTATLFADDPRYTMIYAYDGVVILAVNQQS